MEKKYKLVAKVPKTPKSAYDHGRFISSLIEHQVKHFHEIEKSLLKPGQERTDITKIKPALQASEYLKKMTALLHPQGAEKPRKVAPPTQPRKRANAAKSKSKGKGKTKSKRGKRKSR